MGRKQPWIGHLAALGQNVRSCLLIDGQNGRGDRTKRKECRGGRAV